jgi:ribonuclease P protein component
MVVSGEASFGRDRRVRKRREFLHVQGASRRVTTAHFVLLVAARMPPLRRPAAPALAGATEGTHAPAGVPSPPAKVQEARSDLDAPSRIGFIVTRKIGVAVVRNRIKRTCRECFRAWPGLLPRGVDLVVVAKQGAETIGLAGVRAEWSGVSHLLRRRAEEALALARRGDVPHVSGGRLERERERSPRK